MSEFIRQLIASSFIVSTALFFCPEGGVKRVMRILGTGILATIILSPLKTIDYNVLDSIEARFSGAEAEILNRAAENEMTLKTLLFKQNCEDYIKREAQQLGLHISRLELALRAEENDAMLPYSVLIYASGAEESAERLCRIIQEQLGIPAERQEWMLNE